MIALNLGQSATEGERVQPVGANRRLPVPDQRRVVKLPTR
jgi:hypothetical protein